MRIAIIDNFDSFTWNLFHYLDEIAENVEVIRYDKISSKTLKDYNRIVISPGPGLPCDYPNLKEIIFEFGSSKPILGICLGHQAIAEAYGASLKNLKSVWHGIERETIITDSNELLFNNLSEKITTGHYHSWVVDNKNLPACLEVTAKDKYGTIMAIKHCTHNIKGLQFHPESVMTVHGKEILKNWVAL